MRPCFLCAPLFERRWSLLSLVVIKTHNTQAYVFFNLRTRRHTVWVLHALFSCSFPEPFSQCVSVFVLLLGFSNGKKKWIDDPQRPGNSVLALERRINADSPEVQSLTLARQYNDEM